MKIYLIDTTIEFGHHANLQDSGAIGDEPLWRFSLSLSPSFEIFFLLYSI